MKKNYILLCTMLLLSTLHVAAISSVITLFVKEYPEISPDEILQSEKTETISEALYQPDYLNPKNPDNMIHNSSMAGIWALYKGYADSTNLFGQINFPRKQQSEKVYLIITERIRPAFIVGPSTVAHWHIADDSNTAVYEIALQFDKDANAYYFNTTKVDNPEDNIIPLSAIVIAGSPDHVYVPEGAMITDLTANLLLPPVYLKPDFDRDYNASYTLSLKNYFAQFDKEYEQDDQTVSKLLGVRS